MNYRLILIIAITLFLTSCDQTFQNKSIKFDVGDKYKNSGFALINNKDIEGVKMLESRSLKIYHKTLKKKTLVKITNPNNGKYLIAEVKYNRAKFSNFYNSILSLRIAEELDLDFKEPLLKLF